MKTIRNLLLVTWLVGAPLHAFDGSNEYCSSEGVVSKLLDRVVVPIYEWYDRVYDEGLTRHDCLNLGCVAAGVYSITKCLSCYVQDPQKLIADVPVICATLCVLYAVQVMSQPGSTVEKLKISFTQEQCQFIDSDHEVRTLVANADEDPVALLEHQEFVNQLLEPQRRLLVTAVAEHQVHTQLLEDFIA